MRILHVISGIDPLTGGPAMALAGLAAAQIRAGLDLTIAHSWIDQPASAAERQYASYGAAVHGLGPCRRLMARHSGMAEFLSPLIAQADIVHIHALWEQIQHDAARLCRTIGRPHLFTLHGMLDPWSRRHHWLRKWLYMAIRMRRNLNGANAIHATTQVEARGIQQIGLRPPIFVETLGLDLSEFDPLPPQGAFRARFAQLGNRPIVLFLGRFDYVKGIDLLIPAFAKAVVGDAVLVFAGPDWGYEATTRRLVDEYRLGDRVLFAGMQHGRQRIEALVDAALMVMPSYKENFGVAVIEAMAAETPVLISDQVGVHPEVAAAGAGGVVPANVQSLAAGLSIWMADQSRRLEAGRRGRAFAREHYDWKAIATRWVDRYRSMM